MQSYKIIFSKRFSQELDEILDFIATSNPNQAATFQSELFAKISSLDTMPYRCRKNFVADDENIRDMVFRGYVVVFGVNEKALSVEILGIYKANEWRFWGLSLAAYAKRGGCG